MCESSEIAQERSKKPIKVVVVDSESISLTLLLTSNALFYNLKPKFSTKQDQTELLNNCAGDSPIVKYKKRKYSVVQVKINTVLAYFLIQELAVSKTFRKSLINRIYSYFLNKNGSYFDNIKFKIILVPPERELIDYKWSKRLMLLVQEKHELDHTMSWLSTLGGAFSALGDHFTNCADIAGKISYNQFLLALRIGDPLTVARCKLYLSLSLIQKGAFKMAKRLILAQYEIGKKEKVIDHRLLKMCQGIWTKLKYEMSLKKQGKLLPKMLNTQIKIVK